MDDANDYLPMVVDEAEEISPLAQPDIISIAQNADLLEKAHKRVFQLVVSAAGKNGIDHLGENPYFNAGGCSRIAARVGISWDTPSERKEMEPDGHYTYIFDTTFYMMGRSCPATGSASSSQPWYAIKNQQPVPPAEINSGNVRKHAFTNLLNNGIKSLLGLKNLSWDELEAAGLSRDGGARVSYEREMKEDAQGMKAEIRQLILDMAEGDKDRAQDKLEELTAWVTKDGVEKPGKRQINDLTEKQVPVICRKVRQAHKDWTEAQFEKEESDAEAS